MKKRLYIILSLALVLSLGLTACGKDEQKQEGENAKESETSQEAEDDTASTEGSEEPATPVDFEEIVVVDNDECKITLTGLDPEGLFGYTVKGLFENKTADKTIMFSVEDAFINGVSASPLFASEITAGKKENVEIILSDDILKTNGLTEYTDIEIAIRAYNSDDWEAPDIAKEVAHIYPYGKDKASIFEREVQDTDNVIIDNDYATVVVTGYTKDEIWGYSADLYIVNKFDKKVMFSVDECSIDGMMIDPMWANEVAPNKKAFTSVQWSNESFEENNITEPKEIEFSFRAYNSEEFGGDDFINEVIKLNP